MATIPSHFDEATTLRDKIVYVLSVMHKGGPREIAAEIVELQGIASEEGVAETTVDIESELEKMEEEGLVTQVHEHRQKKRYSLAGSGG